MTTTNKYEQPIDQIDMSNLELYKVQSKSYRTALNKIFFTCLKEIPREILIEGLKKKKIIEQDWEAKGNKYKVEETKTMNEQEKKIQKLINKNKILEEEISNLNYLLSEAGSNDWDADAMYEDARDGTFNGNNIGGVPNRKYAKWLAKRYGLKIDKDDDILEETKQ